jgi:hypothetical protein
VAIGDQHDAHRAEHARYSIMPAAGDDAFA